MVLRVAVALLGVCLLMVPASAQDKPIDFRVLGGVNWGTLNVDPEYEGSSPETYMRFGAGAGLCFHVRSSLAIELQALYMQKGAKFRASDDDMWGADTEIDYFVISPQIRFTPSEYQTGIYLFGGGEFGYMLNAEETYVASATGNMPEMTTDIEELLKSTDLGLNAGLGFQFGDTDQLGFFVEGRYSIGLTDILDQDAPENQDYDQTVKTQGIYLMGGLRF